jgi:hypothetical protein
MARRLWFELRVLWCFLTEIVAHPTVTSRIEIDTSTFTIDIERR